MIWLSEADVARLVTVDDALEAVEAAFRLKAEGQAHGRPRQRVGGRAWLHVMPAAIPAWGVMGFKAYTTGRQRARFMVFLFDSESGEPLAAIEADELGRWRTGAASGVACRYMARPDSRVAALIGCGYQARTQALAIASVLELETIRVFCRTPGRAEAFCRELQPALGATRLEPAGSAAEAARGADVVVTITNARDPVLPADAVGPGTCIVAAGSNHVARRELEPATVLAADRVVVDDLDQARLECGDLVGAEGAGFTWDRVVELADVVAGRVPGRAGPEEITLFESQGVALEDVALARRLLERAVAAGVGVRLPATIGLWEGRGPQHP